MPRSLTKKIAFNTAVQVGGKIVTVFFTLLTTSLLTGYLGVTGFGHYIYVLTLLVLFSSLADWGTTTIGTREMAKNSLKQAPLLGQLFLIKAFFSLLAALILLVILPSSLKWLSFFLVFKAGRDFLAMIWQSRLQMHRTVITDVAASGLIFLISYFLVRLGLGVNQLLLGYLLATAIALVVGLFLAPPRLKLQFDFSPATFKPLLLEILPMGAILLMFTMDNKIDTLMLGMIKGSQAVGIYGLAYRIYDVLILGAAFLMNALLPVFSRWSDLNRWGNQLRDAYRQAFKVLLMSGLAVVLVIFLAAPFIIHVLTGLKFGEFSQAVWVLRFLLVALFLAYFNHLTGYTIVALGKQRPYFLVALSSLIFNIAANLVLIPRFSFYGAVVVTILTEALVLVMTKKIFSSQLGRQ